MQNLDYVWSKSLCWIFKAQLWWLGEKRAGGRLGWQLQEEAALSLCRLYIDAYICICTWSMCCWNGWPQLPSGTDFCRILTTPCWRDQDNCCRHWCSPTMLPFLTVAGQTWIPWMPPQFLRYQNVGLSKLTRVLLLSLCSYHASSSFISCLCFFLIPGSSK